MDDLFSPEMERAFLACALQDPDVVHVAVTEDMLPAHFHDPDNGRIWWGLRELARRGAWTSDDELLQAALREQGWDIPYTRLAELLALNVFPGNAGHYAAKVLDLAQRRAAEQRLQDAAKALYSSNGSWKDDVATPLTALSAELARAEAEPVARPATWADMDTLLAPVAFDWHGWLAPGFLAMVVASSGEGKSNLTLRITGTYTCGWSWPDGTPYTGETGKVLWCEAEAAQAMNLERAKNWGLPIDCILSPLSNPLDDVNLFDAEHLAAISAIAHRDDVRLVVVDSLSAACGGREKAEEQMPVVLWLAALARDVNKPVMVLHHLRKRGMFDAGTSGIGLDRVRGSTVIVQLARLVWALDTPDPNDADHKRLSVIKSNLAKYPEALGLRIDDTGLTFDEAPQAPKTETQLDKAIELLESLLMFGAAATVDLETEARGAGIGWTTMKRAKEKLGIVARRDGITGKWSWVLPVRIPRDEQEDHEQEDQA